MNEFKNDDSNSTNVAAQENFLVSDEILALRAIDQRNAELRARNEARLAAFKVSMGEKYVLHPANAPRKNNYRTVLN